MYLQILDQLFHRCHAIRELTLEKLKTIVSLTLALELSEELPPPAKFHEQLKVCEFVRTRSLSFLGPQFLFIQIEFLIFQIIHLKISEPVCSTNGLPK